jgi:hypothetical protein
MTWHQSRDENYTSPIVKGMRRHKSKPRDRILTDDEIRAVWNAINNMKNFGGDRKALPFNGAAKPENSFNEVGRCGEWCLAHSARETRERNSKDSTTIQPSRARSLKVSRNLAATLMFLPAARPGISTVGVNTRLR